MVASVFGGEHTSATGILHRHTGPSPGMIVRGAIGYTSWSLLVRIDGTLNSSENVSSMIAKRLARHYTPVTTVDELWYRVEAAWSSVTVYAIQALFESMPRTATAGSDVVQSGRPIFDDFFQHLWPYIGNNTANVVFQIVKLLGLIRIDQ
ncbi:odorant receptor [Trichonephila clavipes]|nr:odorant receptor [Trichonephila clavipes]